MSDHPYADLLRAHHAARQGLRDADFASRRADEKATRRRRAHLAAVETMAALDAAVENVRSIVPGAISDEDLAGPKSPLDGILSVLSSPLAAPEFDTRGWLNLETKEGGE